MPSNFLFLIFYFNENEWNLHKLTHLFEVRTAFREAMSRPGEGDLWRRVKNVRKALSNLGMEDDWIMCFEPIMPQVSRLIEHIHLFEKKSLM